MGQSKKKNILMLGAHQKYLLKLGSRGRHSQQKFHFLTPRPPLKGDRLRVEWQLMAKSVSATKLEIN